MSSLTCQMSNLLGLAAGLSLLIGTSGCVIPTRIQSLNPEVARQGVQAASDEGLKTLEKPETQRRVGKIVGSPGIKAVEKELIDGLLDSTVASLGEKERRERIVAASSEMTRSAIKGALDEALSAERKGELQTLTSSLVRSSVEPITSSLSKIDIGPKAAAIIDKEVGPALQKALRENVGPGFTEVMKSDELKRALGENARVMAREAVIGATEAVAAADEKSKREGSSTSYGRAGEMLRQGTRLAGSLAGVLGLVIIVLLAWIVKLLVQSKRLREESERRAATARMLSEAMKVADGKPWSEELMRGLEARIRAEESALDELKKERGVFRRRWRRGQGARVGGADPRPSLA